MKDKIIKKNSYYIDFFNKQVNEEDVFIYSPECLSYLPKSFKVPPLSINSEELGIKRENLDNYIDTINGNIKKVIGIGGGRSLDIAKYIAYCKKSRLVLIPSIISTNSFFTDKAILRKKDNKPHTVQVKLGDNIIIDKDLLLLSDFQWHLYGLADVLSFHTALRDWEIAVKNTNERMVFEDYSFGKMLLNSLIDNINDIINKKDIEKIIQLVLLAGYLVSIHGSGRPESGSEHIFAQLLETKIRIPHGVAVTLGIVIMSEFQENNSLKINNAIREMKLLKNLNKYNISRRIIEDTLLSLKPREDRYTIINQKTINHLSTSKVISNIEKKHLFQLS